MSKIKPIPTYYDGVLFRSRLEARWAVFFDGLGIRWEYEYEGYTDGFTNYLPDFWLPNVGNGIYWEIKPFAPNSIFEEILRMERKLVMFLSGVKETLVLSLGTPWESYSIARSVGMFPCAFFGKEVRGAFLPRWSSLMAGWNLYEVPRTGEQTWRRWDDDEFILALERSRSIRFWDAN